MRGRKVIAAIIVAFLAVALPTDVRGQGGARLKAFAPISVEQRARLAERLELFMRYQRTKRYDKLFDLFPKEHTQHPEITKERYLSDIRKHGKSHLVVFIPAYTRENPTLDGQYEVVGCAKEIDKGRVEWWQISTYVSLENGVWYMSDLIFNWVGFQEKDPIRCTKNGRVK